MELLPVILKQTITMFLLMAVGFVLFRTGKLSERGNRELGTILLYLTLPCVIISSYMTEATAESMRAIGISALVGVVAIAISILMSRFTFGKKRRMEHFCCAFSNAGFIGIPVIEAAIGESAVFYVAMYIAMLNVLQWYYGAPVLAGVKKTAMNGKLWKNPVLVASVIGLALFFSQIRLPGVVTGAIKLLKGMNTPLAMLILGAYLGQMKFGELFTDKWTYICSAFRLLAIPAVCFLALCLVPKEYMELRLVILIASAAPVGSNAPIFAERCGSDSAQAVRCVSMSTVFSVITLPVLIALARTLWR